MAKCYVKRGFFVLRDCANKAREQCKECERGFCSECTAPTSQTVCVECWASQQLSHIRATDWTHQELEKWHTDTWVYAYRNSFLKGTDYKPFYSGKYFDDYYDYDDFRCFEHSDTLVVAGDFELGEGDFFDS